MSQVSDCRLHEGHTLWLVISGVGVAWAWLGDAVPVFVLLSEKLHGRRRIIFQNHVLLFFVRTMLYIVQHICLSVTSERLIVASKFFHHLCSEILNCLLET